MTAKPNIELERTGDPGLDTILGGGMPSQSVNVIAGEPGTGKTILTLQMLFAAAARGRKSLYFTTLSEPAVKLVRYMQGFQFFDADLLKRQIAFVDLSAVLRQGAEATAAEILARVEKFEPAFVAIDSFRAISDVIRDAESSRLFAYDISTQLATWGATGLLVGEYTRADVSRFAEFAIADGIIRLANDSLELTSVRGIEILKMRGADHVSGRHFFDITAKGLRVYPRVRGPESVEAAPAVGDRIGTGVSGLDALFEGGVPRASSTIVEGGAGTGKTILALNFLLEGIKHGERGVMFTLEETPDQLRAIADGLGWDLGALEADGRLAIRYSSPVELSTDRFLNDARLEVGRSEARRVVFDSLTTLSLGVPSERRYKELVYAIAKHMRSLGTTVMMTCETAQLLGTASLSGLGVSFAADNLIQLRFVELDGRLERAVSVIKARGINVNSELRSASIGAGGMTVVGDKFRDMRGVLTGLPSKGWREKE